MFILNALLLIAALTEASPVAAPKRSIQLRGPSRLGKQDNIDAVRAKWETNVKRVRAHERVKKIATSEKEKRASSGVVKLTDVIEYGVDELYYGYIQIGTPAQSVSVDFDTGSADLWAPTSGNSYDLRQSSTYRSSTTPFQVQYGTGSASGTLASDIVSVAGLTVKPQTFGSVTSESADFNGNPAAGILGLAFQSIASDGAVPVAQALNNQGNLASHSFSFYLSRGKQGAELDLGTRNSGKYTGTTYTTAVTSQTYWEVQSSGRELLGSVVCMINKTVAVNGKATAGFPAAIDTGTTLVYVPTSVARSFYSKIPGARVVNGNYEYPCSSTVPLSIGFSNTPQLSISYADFNIGSGSSSGYCQGGIIGMDIQDAYGRNFAIVGDLFLKSWYSTYSFSGPSVSFAKAV